jgi:hypothetical protein
MHFVYIHNVNSKCKFKVHSSYSANTQSVDFLKSNREKCEFVFAWFKVHLFAYIPYFEGMPFSKYQQALNEKLPFRLHIILHYWAQVGSMKECTYENRVNWNIAFFQNVSNETVFILRALRMKLCGCFKYWEWNAVAGPSTENEALVTGPSTGTKSRWLGQLRGMKLCGWAKYRVWNPGG